MNWNKNPPPPGVNPEFSSFHYHTGRFEVESQRPRNQDYSHKPGKPGGGWDEEDEPAVIKPSYNTRNEKFPRPVEPQRPQVEVPSVIEPQREVRNFDRKHQIAVSEQAGVYEKVLVEDITAHGGVRPRPPDKDMHEFLNKCKYLAPEIVVPLLVGVLDNPQRTFVKII